MNDPQQLSLFQADPQFPEEINPHTPFLATHHLFLHYLHKEGKSEHTIKAFRSDLMLVAEYLGSILPIGQFQTENLNQFLHWLEYERGVPCSRKSYARRVTTLKVYFKWLHAIEAIPNDPAKVILQRSGPAPLSDVLSLSQIRDAIAFSRTLLFKKTKEQDYRPELLFRLLTDTGIKKNETVKLTFNDIDRLNPNQPLVTIRQKTRNVYKERRIDLDPDWLKLLDLYTEQYRPKETIFTCTPRNLEYILTDIGKGAGISFKLSFEIMRWTCAVRDYRLGMDDQTNREKMGLSEASWSETGSKIRQLAEKLSGSSN